MAEESHWGGTNPDALGRRDLGRRNVGSRPHHRRHQHVGRGGDPTRSTPRARPPDLNRRRGSRRCTHPARDSTAGSTPVDDLDHRSTDHHVRPDHNPTGHNAQHDGRYHDGTNDDGTTSQWSTGDPRLLTGASTLLPPGGHYLLATGTGQDQSLLGPLTDSFSARVRNGGLVVDSVGTRARIWNGTVPTALWKEGTGLPPLIDSASYTPSWERKSTRGFGNCVDTDDNSADFSRNFTASQVNPQSSADLATPCGTPIAPAPPTHLVISEYRTDGPAGGDDEFAEIFNPTGGPLSLNGILLQTTLGATVFNLPNVMLAPGQHYLVGGPGYAGLVDGTGTGFSNTVGARLFNTTTSNVIDDVRIGVAPPFLPILDERIDHSYERRFRGCQDSATATSWLDDFIHQATPTPTRSTDPFTPC